jgi:hypothetical protein
VSHAARGLSDGVRRLRDGVRALFVPPPTLERPAEIRWALSRILLVFVIARVLVLACALGVEAFAAPDPAGPAGSLRQVSDRTLLASLTSWDGVYYVGIAADGYQPGPVNGPYPEVVFFPLYPALVSAVAVILAGDVALAAVLVANIAGFLALLAVYGLARIRLGAGAAILTVAIVSLQPGAVAFSMAYSDSLFLLLACASLLAAERGRRPTAGVLALLAALTRLQGGLLVVPLLVLCWTQDRGKPRASWLWALAAPLGTLAVAWLMASIAGDPLALLASQAIWELGEVPSAVAEPWVLATAALIYGGTALVFAGLLIDRWRHPPTPSDRAGLAWAVVNVAALLVARRAQSLPRYLAPITQAAEQLAGGRYRPRVIVSLVAASVASYCVLALLHFGLFLAP